MSLNSPVIYDPYSCLRHVSKNKLLCLEELDSPVLWIQTAHEDVLWPVSGYETQADTWDVAKSFINIYLQIKINKTFYFSESYWLNLTYHSELEQLSVLLPENWPYLAPKVHPLCSEVCQAGLTFSSANHRIGSTFSWPWADCVPGTNHSEMGQLFFLTWHLQSFFLELWFIHKSDSLRLHFQCVR